MSSHAWRDDFPILNKNKRQKFIYMDNASTTFKPQIVCDAVNKFYTCYTSTVSRSNHFLSEEVFSLFDAVREKVSSFINAKKNEIIFTHNCTDSINLVAAGLRLKKDDEVILSALEHHSNFLPWQEHATIKVIETNKNGTIDLNKLRQQITNKTKLIAITYISNVTGNVQPVKEIAKIAKENNVLCLVDAAQAAGHISVDVFDINCDFLAFSGHKMLAPSGVGVLYVQSDALEKLLPSKYGGGMVNKVAADHATYFQSPTLYEAGTPNIEGILGLGAAIDYINSIGLENIHNYLNELEKYCRTQLEQTGLVIFPFPFGHAHTPIFSFRPKNARAEIGYIANTLSDVHGIALREGYQCAQPLYAMKGLDETMRVSLYLYNTFDEIDTLVKALKELRHLMS